jgi:orotate phosphoribosyltransferase
MAAKVGTLEDLQEVGAYLRGHFLLTTGRHSDTFVLLARLTEWPERLAPWMSLLEQKLGSIPARTIVGPAVGGIIPAYQFAVTHGNSRVLFAEKEADGTMRFRRGFQFEPGEPVIIVEDAVTTGSSVMKVMDAVRRQGGRVAAIGALVDRSREPLPWDLPFQSVITLRGIENWPADECPLCQAHVPLASPKK